MHGTPLKPLRPGAAIRIPPEPEHRQRVYCIYYQPCFHITRKVYVHNNCRCNEIVALRNRVLFDCIKPTKQRVTQCRTIAKLISDWIPRVPKMDGEWVDAYTGRKRRKYLDAAADLATNPIRRSDSYVAAFIKAEKIFELKDPRLIQARSARYNYELANYLKPIEHALYNIKGTGRLKKWLPPGRLIAKGCNMSRRALLIKKKMARFSQPLVVSLDASRFDAHITDTLRVEHLIYLRYWRDPALQRLLAWQYYNRGRTSTGVRYRIEGSRMSGDMNTALGNCLISIILLANVMRCLRMHPSRWDMLCDGDDCLLFISRQDSWILDELTPLYAEHGIPLKVENVTSQYHKVLFCQGHPIDTPLGPRMVALPERTLSRSLVGVRHWAEDRFVPRYLALIGYCELALNMGVPVMQEFACTVLSWGSVLPRNIAITGRVVKAMREERSHPIQPLPITDAARYSFWEATGIDPTEQRAYEAALRAISRHGPQKKTAGVDQPAPWWADHWSAPKHSSASTAPTATQKHSTGALDRVVRCMDGRGW
nr:hypothetical protein 2 [Mute swan feces associated tombus-like virus 6]